MVNIQTPKKLKCRRIRDIPIDVSKEDLENLLKKSLPAGQSDRKLTLARSSSHASMATLNSIEIPENFLYPFDEEFLGITPLWDRNGATVE